MLFHARLTRFVRYCIERDGKRERVGRGTQAVRWKDWLLLVESL
jgi:hypothetical protein